MRLYKILKLSLDSKGYDFSGESLILVCHLFCGLRAKYLVSTSECSSLYPVFSQSPISRFINDPRTDLGVTLEPRSALCLLRGADRCILQDRSVN